VKLAEAFGCKGIAATDPADKLDDAIKEMIDYDGPVIFDCLVEKHENCFPMIPSGKAHNEMLLWSRWALSTSSAPASSPCRAAARRSKDQFLPHSNETSAKRGV
jgi:glyoxylate carboligase